MAQRKTLTRRQIEVLRWVGDGCPDGVMVQDGYPERITAGALRNRGLVTTAGTGARWQASITDAGVEYLAKVDGPNPPIPREPNQPAWQRLIDEVAAAGGVLIVPSRQWSDGPGTPDYRRRVADAERRGKVPEGKRFAVTSEGDMLRIALVDLPEGAPVLMSPVPVPERVGRYHPVVTAFRGEADRHEVSRAQLPRVCRILQGLVVEAERRSYSVAVAEASKVPRSGGPDWSGEADGHIGITIDGVAVVLRIREDGIGSRKVYPRRDYSYRQYDDSVRRSFAYEEGAKGLVRISILAPHTRSNRQSSWGDGKTQKLEDLLPAVLMEAEMRSAEERERIRIQRQEAELRRLAWERAMEQARVRHTEHHRALILDEQLDAWQRATTIRAYCQAIEELRPAYVAAADWVAWARERADRLDPLGSELALPDPPEKVSPLDLQPFLDGWSPYGPEQSLRGWR